MKSSRLTYSIRNDKQYIIERKTFVDIFGKRKALIGVLHLLPLLGSPLYKDNFKEVMEIAVNEAKIYERAGISAINIENFRDYPFYPDSVPHETVASMTAIGQEIKRAVSVPIGVSVLRNDAKAALAIATAIGASFIRVNVHTGVIVAGQGVISGLSHETLRYREALKSNVLILADIGVKHAAPLADRGLATEARDAEQGGLADALVVSGISTGKETKLVDVEIARKNSSLPILLGSGTTPENAKQLLQVADGAFVGSYFKHEGKGGNLVELERVKKMLRAFSKTNQ